MIKQFAWGLILLIPFLSKAQPNCNVYLWAGDTSQYEACVLSEKFNDYYQFDLKGIAILDSCIAICPYYAYALYEKAVVYLKAGNFIGWDNYINLAVEYDSLAYLPSRASCRGKFFADYQGAIDDIDQLDSLVNYDLGYTHDGTYHLKAYQGLCYMQLGDYEKAIELFELQIAADPDHVGFFDYLHLGISYQELADHKKALTYFENQSAYNNLAENHYYAALSYKALDDDKNFVTSINEAKRLIKIDQKMTDPYHVMEGEIFLIDIELIINNYKSLF